MCCNGWSSRTRIRHESRLHRSASAFYIHVHVDFVTRYSDSGCTSLALVDLAKADADAAASKLAATFGLSTLSYLVRCIVLTCSSLIESEAAEEKLTAIGIECDVADELSVQRAMDEIIAKFGRIDALVASAGEY